jgi:zinc-ribbon domain
VFCPKCGTEHPDDSQFCRKCGGSLTGTVSSTPPAKTKPRRIPIALAVGIVVLLIVVAWIFNSSRLKNTSRTVPAKSVQPSATPAIDTATATPASTATVSPLSPEEIYKMESAGMILIETYDDQGRKRGLLFPFLLVQSSFHHASTAGRENRSILPPIFTNGIG